MQLMRLNSFWFDNPLIRLVLVSCFVVGMQGCASVPKTKPDSAVTQQQYQLHQASLKTIVQFALTGRIGVQTDGKGFSGGLNWQHNEAVDAIALYSPLGGQVARILKTANQVTLEDAKGNTISAADTETLTQNALGWQLPLAGLADWSLGRPTNSPIMASTWNEQGYLSTLKQDGWEIEYQNYTQQNGFTLPSKITLRSDKVNLKLLVESWENLTPSL